MLALKNTLYTAKTWIEHAQTHLHLSVDFKQDYKVLIFTILHSIIEVAQRRSYCIRGGPALKYCSIHVTSYKT